ncbi:MAG: MFS transporter [Oscillospiraceae bacterium]|nr:MFS transporter [Oscillospiraceae bacterium]
MPKAKQYAFFISGSCVMLASTLSSFGIATVTPALLQRFDAMRHYTLTSVMSSVGMLLFLPIVGKLTDTVGRKPMLLIGSIIAAVTSLATGFAPNFEVFIVMRLLITVGTTFCMPIPSATLPFIFERSKLPQLMGIQGSFLALGTFFGSTIAGFLSDMGVAWMACAYPGIVILIASLIMVYLCPDIPRKPLPSIDISGIILLFLIIGPLSYVSSFSSQLGWGSTQIITMLVVMVAALIVFLFVEKRSKSPIVDLSLFKNRVFTGAMICVFSLVVYQTTMRIYAPLVIQRGLGMQAAASGSILLPRSVLNIVCPAFCGAWIAKNHKARLWKGIAITGLLVAAGNLIMSFITLSSTLMVFFIGLGLTGVAESFKQASLVTTVQNSLTAENMGSGISLNSMMGTLGATVSTCIYGLIFDNIAPDVSVTENLLSASNVVHIISALTGVIALVAAFLFIRPQKRGAEEDAKAAA